MSQGTWLAASSYLATIFFRYKVLHNLARIMPRKTPLPERERQICGRLLHVRRCRKIARTVFAQELGIGVSRLANYERAATPLPYSVAQKLVYRFQISQEWLAEGDRAFGVPPISLPDAVEAKLPSRALFTAVYDEFIRPEVERKRRALPQWVREQKVDEPTVMGELVRYIESVINALPAHLVWRYILGLISVSNDFRETHARDIRQFAEQSAVSRQGNPYLTDITADGNSLPVQSKLPQLLERLRRATETRGKKAELARWMGVVMPRISEWLAREREPGGESALRLLAWVQAEEAQLTKSSGGDSSTTGAKTRFNKSKNENSTKSSRPKG